MSNYTYSYSHFPFPVYSSYYDYNTTAPVPDYALQHTLQSIADQQARINAQKAALEEEERQLRRRRQATLRRMRAQRLREVMGEPEIEAIVMQIAERDQHRTMDDSEIADAVMEILKNNDPRSMARGWNPAAKGLQVREMLDPSPRAPQFIMPEPHGPSPVFHIPTYHTPSSPATSIPVHLDTPVVDELPSQQQSEVPSPEYFLEPALKNKRGSGRHSIRRDSQTGAGDTSSPPQTTTVTVAQTLTSYTLLRTKLHNEINSIPESIRMDAKPTPDERKVLHHHMAKLEDILDEVDAVPTPDDEQQVLVTRKARREVVAEIVNAIDKIERFMAPETPAGTSAEETASEAESEPEGGLIDEEIQKVIWETLARKKDEDSGSGSRRSVTVETVPDEEY